MNQTGEDQGRHPVSFLRALFVGVAGTLIAAVGVFVFVEPFREWFFGVWATLQPPIKVIAGVAGIVGLLLFFLGVDMIIVRRPKPAAAFLIAGIVVLGGLLGAFNYTQQQQMSSPATTESPDPSSSPPGPTETPDPSSSPTTSPPPGPTETPTPAASPTPAPSTSPPISSGPTTEYLTDLEMKDGSGGGWVTSGRSINGKTYGRSLYRDLNGCTTASSVEYVLGRDWGTFEATIGLDDNSPDPDSSVLFEVFADTKRIYQKELRYGEDATVKLPIDKVLNLRLAVTLRDGKRGACGDTNYPSWGDPTLSRNS